ncbi:hypothetical protein [Arenimonas donghaensis]|uniref:Uncharacterized protein n=1 Tax=Arenimonas donghaensis DSM 18148 = HO3-R19 TaxID=1121014 RepID=A0A087ML55_9GAMM|nr:hypothetical protein [Arenimonas donghaensis]KFL37608.1 hypothetical protein N788_00115 [Arenimonas donghaensis DSM 18148 = HO3-R19]
MKTPQDPRKDTLQDDEADLAKVLRALPGGEPSPRVDAAILAAARDASSGSSRARHRRRGLPGWALGTAAAAVLAVGIGLQLDLGRESLPDGVPAQTPAEASDGPGQPELGGARLERMPEAEAEAEADAGAPVPQAKPESPAARRQAPAAPASAPEPAEAFVAPPPPPPAPRAVASDRREAARSDAAEAVAAPAQALAPTRSREVQSVAPAPIGESTPRPQTDDSADPLPSAFSADDVLPPVEEDARLDAEAWLERIRERVRQGDRAGASASLRRFERDHPDLPLPPDLAAFRP